MLGKERNILGKQYQSRVAFFLERCKDLDVLHLGCSSGRYLEDRLGRGSFLHGQLLSVSRVLFGLDIERESLEKMKELGFDNLVEGNAENLEDVSLSRQFDVVLAGDLLEHITRPGAMLDGVKRLLKRDGCLIISTNNAFGLHYQLKRWAGRYSEHFEHVCFYSPETLAHLFRRHDYQVSEMYGAFTEPPYGWRNRLIFAIGKPLFKLFPVLSGTLIVVAVPSPQSKEDCVD